MKLHFGAKLVANPIKYATQWAVAIAILALAGDLVIDMVHHKKHAKVIQVEKVNDGVFRSVVKTSDGEIVSCDLYVGNVGDDIVLARKVNGEFAVGHCVR